MIISIDQLDMNLSYSYTEYLTWKFQERVEPLKGKISMMSPAPNVRYQNELTQLQGRLFQLLKNKPCNLFSAPFDVHLYHTKISKRIEDVLTVVQLDL